MKERWKDRRRRRQRDTKSGRELISSSITVLRLAAHGCHFATTSPTMETAFLAGAVVERKWPSAPARTFNTEKEKERKMEKEREER